MQSMYFQFSCRCFLPTWRREVNQRRDIFNKRHCFEIALSQTLIRFKITLKGKHADSLGAVKSDICLDQSLLKYLACFISARRLFSVLSGANLPAKCARVCSAKNWVSGWIMPFPVQFEMTTVWYSPTDICMANPNTHVTQRNSKSFSSVKHATALQTQWERAKKRENPVA